MGDAYQDNNLVLCHEDGTPYTDGDVLRRFQKLTAAAGIGSDWVPRELRHTFVSLLSDNDMPDEAISDLVGHSSTHTTRTVYRHQLRPVLNKGAETMNEILRDKKPKSA